MVTAVVFDLDGILIDSEPVWERVRRSYVDEHGGTWASDAQQRLMGMSTPEWATSPMYAGHPWHLQLQNQWLQQLENRP